MKHEMRKDRLSDEELSQIVFYAGEAMCHPDPNYSLAFEALSHPANVLALANEVIAARALLAAHEQEPVGAAAIATLKSKGYIWNGGAMWKPPLGPKPDFSLIDRLHAEIDSLKAQLATHPAPVPAVPDEISTTDAMKIMNGRVITMSLHTAYKNGWNACRAAMLNGGKS